MLTCRLNCHIQASHVGLSEAYEMPLRCLVNEICLLDASQISPQRDMPLICFLNASSMRFTFQVPFESCEVASHMPHARLLNV